MIIWCSGKCEKLVVAKGTNFCTVITDFCTIVWDYLHWNQPLTVEKRFPVYY